MRFLRRLFSFHGRANRREYWVQAIPITAAIWISLSIFYAISETSLWGAAFLLLVVFPAASVANCALGARRLHDRGRSAWWLVPYYGVPTATTVALGMMGEDTPTWLAIPLLLPMIAALVDLGALAGTPGSNRYGDGEKHMRVAAIFD